MNDPIVQEVRKIRDELAVKAGYDVRVIFRNLKKAEAKSRWKRGRPSHKKLSV